MKISRRDFLKGTATSLFLAGFNFPVLASTSKKKNLIVIMLRGGMDGLCAVPVIGDKDFEKDWMSTELIIRRVMYAKTAFFKYNTTDQLDENLHEKIIRNNFDNPDKILKLVSRAKSPEEKHIILFNLPEVLKAWRYQEEIF